MGIVLIVLLILVILSLVGVPHYPAGYAYWPSSILGTILVILLILWLIGRV